MADHYARAIDLLDEVENLTVDLKMAYRAKAAREQVADIHAALSRSLKLADIHATLSVRQAIEDTVMTRAAAAS